MIDKKQPMWINFHNLNVENLQEIIDFMHLYNNNFYAFYPEGRLQNQQELIWRNIQDLFRTEQRKIWRLINIWLDKVKPALKTRSNKFIKFGWNFTLLSEEEVKLKSFQRELSAILNNTIRRVFANDNVLEMYQSCVNNVIWEIQNLNNIPTDICWQIDYELVQIQEENNFVSPDTKIQESLLHFVMAVIEDSKKSQIHRCELSKCNNIFLKSGKGSGKRKYCSNRCSLEAKRENDREEVRKEAAKVYKALCNLLDEWLKQDSEWITASQLQDDLLLYLAETEGSYKPGSTETPFLGGSTAYSLGKLLPRVKERLQERRILIEIKKRKKEYLYRFIRTQ